MTQNINDYPDFFAGYSRLSRSIDGLDGAAEWPALRAMLPDPRGLRIVDLGCGFGWFCRWARQLGAAHVLGLDVSENMLARAGRETSDPAIRYANADLEALSLPAASFDLAYASLVLHYVQDVDRLLATVRDALSPGGHLVFSIERPIYTAPTHPGWIEDVNGRKTWPLDGYLIEGPRRTDWLTNGVIKQHRTVAHYLNALIRQGFTLTHIEDWGPNEAQIAARPELADERHRPFFLLVAARRAT
jgi:ubiquinone/menaquinone biosynthesis C-methylase UbiE